MYPLAQIDAIVLASEQADTNLLLCILEYFSAQRIFSILFEMEMVYIFPPKKTIRGQSINTKEDFSIS